MRDLLHVRLNEGNAEDSGKETIGGFLAGMIDLETKRPYGNSGWYSGLIAAFIAAGQLRGEIDEWGGPVNFDWVEANALVARAVEELKGMFA